MIEGYKGFIGDLSKNEGMGYRENLSQSTKDRLVNESTMTLSSRGKLQWINRALTRETFLTPREEEWMGLEEPMQKTIQQEPLSYREALQPKSTKEGEEDKEEKMEEVWDGNLIFANDKDLKTGIKFIESASGPIIEFIEEEKQRLE